MLENHLKQKFFPWFQYDRNRLEAIEQMMIDCECPVTHRNSCEDVRDVKEQPENEHLKHFQLQLRQRLITLSDIISGKIIDFFVCGPCVCYQTHKRQNNTHKGKKNVAFLTFMSKDDREHPIEFNVRLEDAERMDFFLKRLQSLFLTCLIVNLREDFMPIRKLFQSKSISVYDGIRLKDNVKVAIKGFPKESYYILAKGNGKLALDKEIKIMSELSHRGVAELYSVYETQKSVYLVMELFSRSFDNFLKYNFPLNSITVANIMWHLLKAVQYMHSKRVMHRDLKIDNLMLRAKGSTVEPVIIDFGLAEYYSNEKYLFECCGTPGWMAPELFLPHKADHPERCDLFSLGVILHQILFGKPVFEGTHLTLRQSNRIRKPLVSEKDLTLLTPDMKQLLLKLLQTANASRISAREALELDIFKNQQFPIPIENGDDRKSRSFSTLSMLTIAE